ncbi:hypothetical protein ACOME3_009978 [Neoechinorhynchus agilis]
MAEPSARTFSSSSLRRTSMIRTRSRIYFITSMLFPLVVLVSSVISKISLIQLIQINENFDRRATSYATILPVLLIVTYPQFISITYGYCRGYEKSSAVICCSVEKSVSKMEMVVFLFTQIVHTSGTMIALLCAMSGLNDFAKINFSLGFCVIPLICRLFHLWNGFSAIARSNNRRLQLIFVTSTLLAAFVFAPTAIGRFLNRNLISPRFWSAELTMLCISCGWMRFVDRHVFSLDCKLPVKLFKISGLLEIVAAFTIAFLRGTLFNGLNFTFCKSHLGHVLKPVVVHILSSALCFIVARASCKVNMSSTGFLVPISLSYPITLLALIIKRTNKGLSVIQLLKENEKTICIGFGLWLCQLLLSLMLIDTDDRSRKSYDSLFAKPTIQSPFIEQSLIYNHIAVALVQLNSTDNRQSSTVSDLSNQPLKPMVYICATMWHETMDEMKLLLKSLSRLERTYNKEGPFDYEVHLFFDDAFVYKDGTNDPFEAKGIATEGKRVLNEFVLQFLMLVDSFNANTGVSIGEPTKVPTPYGGRLEWSFHLSNRKMIAHLKDKELCRNKKRWSQVMYMFYLLRYMCIFDSDRKESEWVEEDEVSTKSKLNKTYILAIDGDVDFQPESVEILVERMNKNHALGAACGQILPTGGGPLLWLQRFEYAIGHWLQKAAEHKLGCVLCSPGCFSLFRGSALNDPKIIMTYAKESKSSSDFIQYDQGEDRWLCTLLLKRGYLVEYCAASMAYAVIFNIQT